VHPGLKQKFGIWHSKVESVLKGCILMSLFLRDWLGPIKPKVRLRPRQKGEKLRIAIVTEYYYPSLGGITEHVHHFARELIQRGHEIKIITADAGPFGRDTGEVGPHVIKIGRSVSIYANDSFARVSIGRNISSKLENILTQEKFDIVHVHSPLTPTLPLSAIRYSPVPVLGTFHTHFNENFWMSLFHSRLLPYMNALNLRIAVSPVCIKSLERFFPAQPFVVIPNGIDVDWYNPNQAPISSLNDGHFNVLYVGRFDPRNGLDLLIEAFKALAPKYPNLRLIIIGYGPLETTYRQMVPQKWKERVIFVGKVDEKRPAYYRSAHVLCFPAKKGSFGITLLEAMASGIPVITTDIEGFRFVMRHKVHGLMVREEEGCQGYIRALEYLLQNPHLCKEWGKNARQRALDFSWPQVTEQILHHYYEILS